MAGKVSKKSGRDGGRGGTVAGKRVVADTGRRSLAAADEQSASRLIDQRIDELGDWRGETLARMRALILEADPDMSEEWKWRGTPVWSHHGIVCTGETYTKVVKLTFAHGAKLPDPAGLFNASLEGNTRRAIDIHAGEKVDARAFKALVKAAVVQNSTRGKKSADSQVRSGNRSNSRLLAEAGGSRPADEPKRAPRRVPASKAVPAAAPDAPGKPKLLSGGNPQIAKADGDAPVQAYIAAMPGWKSDVGRRLDAIIVRSVPDVRKAVRWNSPFYGLAGRGWFVSYHCFTRYVKVTFFDGASLRPVPPGESKDKNVRYLDIHENDPLDEAQLADWFKQAAQLPGWGNA